MCILNTFAEYCTPEALVSGETSIQDWAIRASSLKGSTPYDVRLNKLPGKADPKGWLASMPQSTDRTTLSEEWIQVLLTQFSNSRCASLCRPANIACMNYIPHIMFFCSSKFTYIKQRVLAVRTPYIITIYFYFYW